MGGGCFQSDRGVRSNDGEGDEGALKSMGGIDQRPIRDLALAM